MAVVGEHPSRSAQARQLARESLEHHLGPDGVTDAKAVTILQHFNFRQGEASAND